MNKKKCFSSYLAMILLALMLSGCAGTVKHMRTTPLDKIVTVPGQGKSMIVFLRPSGIGYAVQSSVFEIVKDEPTLVGIVAAKKKVSYQLEPGEHLFMVIGENADFMSTKLEANRTYYAIVSPRMGWWKARFSLKPMHADSLNSSQLAKWLTGCEWVEKIPGSDQWASNNMPSIKSKYHEYYTVWMSKSWSDRPKLQIQDGNVNKQLTMESLKPNDEYLNNYSSPQNRVDSFDNGEYEYSYPQDPENN